MHIKENLVSRTHQLEEAQMLALSSLRRQNPQPQLSFRLSGPGSLKNKKPHSKIARYGAFSW
jgi:hypothetical protein